MLELQFLEQKIKQLSDNISLYEKTVTEIQVDLDNFQTLASHLEEALENQRDSAVVSINSRKDTVHDCRLVNGNISACMSKIANYNRSISEYRKEKEILEREYAIKTADPGDNVVYLDEVKKNARK